VGHFGRKTKPALVLDTGEEKKGQCGCVNAKGRGQLLFLTWPERRGRQSSFSTPRCQGSPSHRLHEKKRNRSKKPPNECRGLRGRSTFGFRDLIMRERAETRSLWKKGEGEVVHHSWRNQRGWKEGKGRKFCPGIKRFIEKKRGIY